VKFKEVFACARREGYRLTMHCDVDQENSVGHIWQCLDEIGVERIDHGVNALEDSALIEEINRRRLGLTVCPISNGYVTDGLKAGEVKMLLDHGVRATVNSDDPAYFSGYMNENFVALQEAVHLTRDEIVQLARNAFTVSWLAPEDRSRYLDTLKEYAASSPEPSRRSERTGRRPRAERLGRRSRFAHCPAVCARRFCPLSAVRTGPSTREQRFARLQEIRVTRAHPVREADATRSVRARKTGPKVQRTPAGPGCQARYRGIRLVMRFLRTRACRPCRLFLRWARRPRDRSAPPWRRCNSVSVRAEGWADS
jgi:hypothetical protein